KFNMLIARMEPENNIETILHGHADSKSSTPLILVGNYENNFGSYLKEKYESKKTIFVGAIYDLSLLNNLRYYSSLYFHGHSVGGTNPSLLEAMASGALIVAHDNIFNKSVLENDAFYFNNADDVKRIAEQGIEKMKYANFLANNKEKIALYYSWDYITTELEKCLTDALHERQLQK
ncbi:MAG: glycosyltransferase family 1 protein, partial [Bacteroidetes bacterium]